MVAMAVVEREAGQLLAGSSEAAAPPEAAAKPGRGWPRALHPAPRPGAVSPV